MPEILLIRHGQASFGADDYDVLSPIGHRQAEALGRALVAKGLGPDRVVEGTMRRQRETAEALIEGLGASPARQVDGGFDEFDFVGLLAARYPDGVPPAILADRKAYFGELRDVLADWHADRLAGPPERFADFTTRVLGAFAAVCEDGSGRTAVVTSGGPIALLVAHALGAPSEAIPKLQLQIANASLTRFRVGRSGAMLQTFNETPHVDHVAADLLTYS